MVVGLAFCSRFLLALVKALAVNASFPSNFVSCSTLDAFVRSF